MKRFACRLFSVLVLTCTLSVTYAATTPSVHETLRKEALNISAWALSALDETVPPDIRRNLTFLREDLLDEGKSAPPTSEESYKLGTALCDLLIVALDEHDQAAVKAGYRAAQANANTKITSADLEIRHNYLFSWTQYAKEQNQRAEIARQQSNQVALANQQVRVEWANRSAQLRFRLDEAYKRYRAALRKDPKLQISDAASSDSLIPPYRPFILSTNSASDSATAADNLPKDVPAAVYDLLTPEFAALSQDESITRITAKVKQMNPEFNGVINWTRDKTAITGINFCGARLVSLWPICALVNLKVVACGANGRNRAPLNDLSPLRGLQLREVIFQNTKIKDLSPLTGMPLNRVVCRNTLVTDLSPLQGMSLGFLCCAESAVRDLSPLAGMPLRELVCNHTLITDLSPLKGMQNLSNLNCDFKADRDAEILRSITSLRHINGFLVKDFWKRVDAGESPQVEDSR